MKKIKNYFAILGVLFILPFAAPASAQEDFDFDKFQASVGAFFPSAETTVRLDASNGALGTTIKFEDDLGVSRKEGLFRFDGYWRPKRRHALTFGYYDFNRSGIKIINKNINFGDQTFVINSQVDSIFDLKLVKLAYTYFVVAKEKTTVGLSVGFNVSDVDVGLTINNTNIRQFRNTSVPVPVFGINGIQDLGGNFTLIGSVQFFYLDLGSEDATLFDGVITLNYRITKNIGIGIGYNYFSFKANQAKPAFTGRFKLTYDGLMAFLNIYF